MSAVNALRETFVDDDRIRWHPIVTKAGEAVNNIPDEFVIESQLRGANYSAHENENEKVNRALIGAALSFGVQIEINDEFAYSPFHNDINFAKLAKDAFNELDFDIKCGSYGMGRISAGCTDIGDLSALIPVIHPYIGGAVGKGHGDDYYIADKELALIYNAKWQTAIVVKLLENNASCAKDIIKSFNPLFKNKDELFNFRAKFKKDGDRIEYRPDGEIIIK